MKGITDFIAFEANLFGIVRLHPEGNEKKCLLTHRSLTLMNECWHRA